MVITIAKAYKRGGNVACVTAADMFLTEVSSIISGYSFSDVGYPVLTDASGSIIMAPAANTTPATPIQSARFPAKKPRTALPPAR